MYRSIESNVLNTEVPWFDRLRPEKQHNSLSLINAHLFTIYTWACTKITLQSRK